MAPQQAEIESLKETLQTQQKLLRQLYAELEAEREASSSAASEALSMILRLQEEKAACQLEACQFKRMTEEKMNHAEEIQHVFQEIMHKKEMEMASLEFQVKAYHYKLLSLGGMGESQSREPEFNSPPASYPLSRNQSLPALPFTHSYRDVPQITVEELITTPSKANEHSHEFYFQSSSVPKISGLSPPVRDLSSHWQQIKELDERVKGLSRAALFDQTIEEYNRLPSSKELRAASIAYPDELQLDLDPSFQLPENDLMMGVLENEENCRRTYSGSSSQVKDIHDVFEVPQTMLCSPQKRQGKKSIQEEDNRLGNPDPFQNGTIKCCCRDEAACGKSSSSKYSQTENLWTKQRDGANLNTQSTIVGFTNQISPLQTDFQQLNQRLGKLENERRLLNQKISGPNEENLRLLREIREKLDTIQLEITSTKSRNHPAADDVSLVSLMEAMFFYSL